MPLIPLLRRSILTISILLSCPNAWADTPPLACPTPQLSVPLTIEERAARDEANRNAPAHLRANRIQVESGGITELEGAVELIRGTDHISSEHLRYEQPTETAEAKGGVQYRDGMGNTFYTEALQLQLDTRLGETGPSRYTVGRDRGRGDAANIDFRGPDLTRFNEVRFTTCREGQDDWFLKVRQLELDTEEDVGTAYHATIDFFGTPLFYFPYMNFPISDRRRSGFLIPSAGHSSRLGYIVATPYYFNLAPNYDATITPRLLTKRGVQLQNQFRYLTLQSEGKIELDVLPNDKVTDDDRAMGMFQHQHSFNPLWAGKIDVSGVSDKDYFQDFGDRLSLTSQTHLTELMEAVYRGPSWSFATRLAGYQVVDKTIEPQFRPYARLPQIQLLREDLALPNRWHPLFETEWNSFYHEDLMNGQRLNLNAGMSLPLQNEWAFLTPKIGVRHIGYRLDRDMDDSPALARGVFSLDSGLFFERDSRWGNRDMIQTMEPRLFYLYIPFKNQDQLPVFDSRIPDLSFASLFRENRFIGGDRIGDANQITAAITSRFIDAGDGTERLRLSLGRIYYFDDPKVDLPTGVQSGSTDFAAEASAWLIGNWHVRDTVLWHHGDRRVDRNSFYLQYHPASNKIFNLGQVFARDQIGQYDVSVGWPLFGRWSVFGRSLRSTRDDRNIETYAGVEYDACCWALRVVGSRRWQDPDQVNSIMVELQLTGLSKLGNVPESPLKQGLFSFRSNPRNEPVRE